MPDLRYEKIQALIVDDFDNFRIMLFNMLQELGIPKVDMASSDQEALGLCATNTYDIILCDQNLGNGKSGQQILEVLRHRPNLNSDSIFVVISAAANKSIILAAFDYEPDDYLTKPITPRTLEQRLSRLLTQRLLLTPIYAAIKKRNINLAIDLCRCEISGVNRYSNHCQKLLGYLLLEADRCSEAEHLYRDILELHQLDWAMLGMAHVKKRQGDSLSAQHWLEELIQFNPLCLKAYDLLADILGERGDFCAQQEIFMQALVFSPLSVLRQQELAKVTLKNNDLMSSVDAFRNAVKLGENSCHDNLDVHINFIRSTIQLAKIDKKIPKPILRDAFKSVSEFTERFGKSADVKVNAYLLESQLYNAIGEEKQSKEAMFAAEKVINKELAHLALSTKIEWVTTLRSQDKVNEAERITKELISEYHSNEDALQKIDSLLEEPCSEMNKALVEKTNKDGIAYYDAKDFTRAIAAFNSALQGLPQHIGLRLNLAQALIEQLKLNPESQKVVLMTRQTLNCVLQTISSAHAQYFRFRQLEEFFKLYDMERNLPH